MKITFLILIIFLELQVFGQNIPIPKGFEVLAKKVGDLDKDGIDENVIVYNTTDTTENGIVREIQILKKIDNKWNVWKKSRNAIGKSQDGGMMGDPFQEIEISNGLLIIKSAGGSSWKWNHTDKYRFQHDEFELIGYSAIYGKLCEYWEDVDFNLMTGKIIYKKEYEDCEKNQQIYKKENETFFKKGILINLNNRIISEHKIVSPKYKHELFL